MRKTDKKISVILLAAGKSKRFQQDKTFFEIEGIPIAVKSLLTILSLKFIDKIFIVSSNDNFTKFQDFILGKDYEKKIVILKGSDTRSSSFLKAVDHINRNNIQIDYLIIHDAARPYASQEIFLKGIDLLQKYDAVIPGLSPTDTVKIFNDDGFVTETLDRNKLINVQTPQFFKKDIFFENIKNISPSDIYTDDSSLLDNTSIKVKIMPGEINNIKITTKYDVENKLIYYGTGFDLHELEKGSSLRLGGIDIEFQYRLKGHSDGDVLIHSMIDSILGAASLGDIGKFFPSTDKSLRGIDSTIMLKKVSDIISEKKFKIVNLDNTIIAQKPRMTNHIEDMKLNLAKILRIDPKQINIKSTTTDFIGIIGSEKAIASQSICSLKKN